MALSYGKAMLVAAALSLAVAILGFVLWSDVLARFAGAVGATAFTACTVGAFHYSAKAHGKRIRSFHHLLAAILSGVFAIIILCVTHGLRSGDLSMLWPIVAAPVVAYVGLAFHASLPSEQSEIPAGGR